LTKVFIHHLPVWIITGEHSPLATTFHKVAQKTSYKSTTRGLVFFLACSNKFWIDSNFSRLISLGWEYLIALVPTLQRGNEQKAQRIPPLGRPASGGPHLFFIIPGVGGPNGTPEFSCPGTASSRKQVCPPWPPGFGVPAETTVFLYSRGITYGPNHQGQQKKFQGNPIYQIENSLDVTALLATATVKSDGDMSSEEKRALLGVFQKEFR